ncbi:NADP-dependent oxidoreductase [Chitinophaga sp. Mgbs1]|uniref:NADP-dependent oxidoreductase n=1 Tax=Chitinophaga solisilvae TaxID=1233460 RepID=A0A433WH11_9BACT|nr:NADP-dependent oxidoreductase [Chitinophaga solisilvae]
MKAIIITENGGTEKLTIAHVAKPEIKADEVLIRNKAISINPVDNYLRQDRTGLNAYFKPLPDQDSFILGWDISGVVEAVGSAVKDFKAGDEVFGMVNFPGQGRAYAEYVAAPASHLALKPAGTPHTEAAGATLAALTAWQGLVTIAGLKKGEKVLIHAANGGVGHYAVQIAHHLGAYVIATGSGANEDFVKSLGADEFIDYTREKFEDRVKDADIVFEAIAGDQILRSLDAVKNGGRLISLLTFIEGEVAEKAKQKNVSANRILVVSNGEDMKQLADLLASGALRTHVSAVYPFEEMAKAHQQIATGKTRGKLAIEL